HSLQRGRRAAVLGPRALRRWLGGGDQGSSRERGNDEIDEAVGAARPRERRPGGLPPRRGAPPPAGGGPPTSARKASVARAERRMHPLQRGGDWGGTTHAGVRSPATGAGNWLQGMGSNGAAGPIPRAKAERPLRGPTPAAAGGYQVSEFVLDEI